MHTVRFAIWIVFPVALLVLCGVGCSNANKALSDASVPLAARAMNRTRSALFADIVPPPEQPQPAEVRGERAVRTTRAGAPLPEDADGVFVGLSISGGGSRSANFGAAVMFQLERAGLLQRVDYISSVSGGSLPAAYYCASGPADWNPAAAQRKLTHAFASDLIGQTLLPWNWLAFIFTDYDRSDVLAASFEQNLFSRGGKGLTYADLRSDRPRLLVNATDLQSGRRFVFCNETFDDLNSDLGKFPLAYAAASSAAVPVLLHPVSLRDYSTIYKQYRHLIDGGINDNLGVQTLVETYGAQVRAAREQHRPDPYAHGAVFVIIDAHTAFNARLSAQSDVGLITSLKTAAGLTSTALLNRASSATLAETIVNSAPGDETVRALRDQLDHLNRDGVVRLTDEAGHPVRVIYISLGQINGLSNLPFTAFSESVNNIETYFNIAPTEAYDLYQAADLLMREKFEGPVRDIVREIETGRAPDTQPAN